MRIEVQSTVNMKTADIIKATDEATKLGLRDTIVSIHNYVVKKSPWLTGNNARSIASEVSTMGVVVQEDKAQPEKVVDDNKNEAACYSTSGYGGYLETGTVKMNARPYFRPALDFYKDDLPENIKKHMESGK